jgi:hypothetical protein
MFNSEKIDDSKTILDVGIKNKSVIQLLPTITIENKTVAPPEIFELSFEWKDTIENIKEKIIKEKKQITLLHDGE